MSRLAITSLLLASLVASCNQDKQSDTHTTLKQEQTQVKPTVAIVPVIDSTKTDLEWNLSDEFSSSIYYQLSQSDDISLVRPNQIRSSTKKLQESQNPFGADTNWMKKTFANDQFVAFLELVEHEEVLRQDRKKPNDQKNCAADLNISMRVRVFDLRGKEPKVILQELVEESHFVPRQYTQANLYQAPWGHEGFYNSPMGLAHAQFTKAVAKRVEDYILLASRQ